MIPFRRISSTLTALLLLLCFACACRQAPRQLTFQVIDAEGNPLPNVQVHYGISNPETFEFIGFTEENGSVVWNDPLTGKQNIYIWRSEASGELSMPQHFPFQIRRSDFGTTTHYRRGGKAGKAARKPLQFPASNQQRSETQAERDRPPPCIRMHGGGLSKKGYC